MSDQERRARVVDRANRIYAGERMLDDQWLDEAPQSVAESCPPLTGHPVTDARIRERIAERVAASEAWATTEGLEQLEAEALAFAMRVHRDEGERDAYVAHVLATCRDAGLHQVRAAYRQQVNLRDWWVNPRFGSR